ncbi:MAG: cell surface protein SprA [Bacteroides sp.]|nr:cell surface protein SprA [Bacteroides sp.]
MKLRVRHFNHKILRLFGALVLIAAAFTGEPRLHAQYYQSELKAPAGPLAAAADTVLPDGTVDVRPTIPRNYQELMEMELASDLSTPSNLTSDVEFDPLTGNYLVRYKLGDTNLTTPFMLSKKEYEQWMLRRTMQQYWAKRNAELSQEQKDKQPFNILDMNFALGPLEKIFGPGGVSLKTTGSVQLNIGVKSNKTDNPALSLQNRRKTFFDFDQKIQAAIQATVGNRLSFNMTYNTDATFDFDSKNLKLGYEGEEDDIVKLIEAGNVSMTTGSSLIRGAQSLFGFKTKLQFGKLTATALISQQNSESKSVSSKGGVQTIKFSINADKYDENRHFFLSHFFRRNYDRFAAKLPYVQSGINITRIQVWITNKNSNFSESRNLVAFMDLGENEDLACAHWVPNMSAANPSNSSNNLLQTLKTDYPTARNINSVTQALEPLAAYGFEGGRDYEKIESARLLSSSEYTLNSSLGYISLRAALSADEVLAVAFEYTYNGKVYQVGEFSDDITTTADNLYLKMLKSTTVAPRLPMWRLMMKNVYQIPDASKVSSQNFKMQIKYLSDTTGTAINYLPVPSISNKTLLQVMNLDRLDSNQESNPDGFFDFLDGYTILPATGRIIFPVAEPFGAHLESVINDRQLAEKYVYKELYDSTQIVAQQFQDKNKFMLTGEFKGSDGSRISLGASNVPRGSVIVMAGGVKLTENSDYIVDYNSGTVTIVNQSIIDSGQNISVTLENQSLYSLQRKTLLGLDLNYQFNKNFNLGMSVLHFGEKALTEKVAIGEETINNTIWGANLNYSTEFQWLTNWLNLIPTVNAEAPSRLSVQGEFAQLVPHKQKSGSNKGSSYVDDFEETQTGIDLRSPHAWQLASTPSMFAESTLSNNPAYGYNRALLNWYYIDRLFTQRNSSLCPAYIKSDLKQLSNPYVREVTSFEIFPGRQLTYGETNTIQTLNLSFYPTERGPYNTDADRIDSRGNLLAPETRWGGIMRKLETTNFESANIEYVQFWLMNPFLDEENNNLDGGDLYFNFGEISEDILKDGFKSYENGVPYDGNDQYMRETAWGRVCTQASMTYSFDNNSGSRPVQDVGLDGLINDMEYTHPTYEDFLTRLRSKLDPTALGEMAANKFSPLNDPAGDNYHFYRGEDYDRERLSILERYKRYNGVEGNSLSAEDADDPLYQSSRSTPNVEDINQDNTLNEYERYFQYRVSIRPEDLVVGQNYITDKQVSAVSTRDGKNQIVEWYQFKIPLQDFESKVGSISDLSAVRFVRMFMTGFKEVTHLRFATLELVKGEWRGYNFNLNNRSDTPAEGELDLSVVNIEENAGREPVNYVLPPGVTRISDPGQSQIVQLNEQSMSMKVTDLRPSDARGVYRNTTQDLRNYKRMQMWVHAEAPIDNTQDLRSGQFSIFLRLGSDVKANYYEYEVPLELTAPGKYNNDLTSQRQLVWPLSNRLDFLLQNLVKLKNNRNRKLNENQPGVSHTSRYSERDPDHEANTMTVVGNPTLGDVRVMLIGVRNNSSTNKSGTVWVNELKVTEFDEEGGWAAKANVNLAMSDVATFNFGAHLESSGFGAVDQSLNERRMDDYQQLNFAMQVDAGRFLPEKAKLRAPIYYATSTERITPKYNPLDTDVRLKDALDECSTKQQKDSIKAFAIDQTRTESFSISGLKFDVKSKNSMPWDPANFTLNFSFNKQRVVNPTVEYENTNDYRGSFQYAWSPFKRTVKPFKKLIDQKNKNLKFFREWEFGFLMNNITFMTNISRYYYENQARSEVDDNFQLPVSVSKNFLWDRKLSLNWNLTKTLSFRFESNTRARIEETAGAVNRRLFPDRYQEWKDTVLSSIRSLGTPQGYNQSFSAEYKLPFNQIPILDWLSGSAKYSATYQWDRGATVDGESVGNNIANRSEFSADGRINFEGIYNKSKFLKGINSRFGGKSSRPTTAADRRANRPKRYERTFKLKPDTSLVIKHNLKVKKVRVTASTPSGQPVKVETRQVDDSSIEVLTRGEQNVKFVITEVKEQEKKSFWSEAGAYSLRFLMMPRNFSARFKRTQSLAIPLYRPSVGAAFGQTQAFGPMAPGLDFAFGFVGESYVSEAKERGWLMTDDGQTSPASFNRQIEVSFEAKLEPAPGLKIDLNAQMNDSRSRQIQFMFDDMPTSRNGSYTKTHIALATALRTSNAKSGYYSKAFANFLEYIPIMRQRVQNQYASAIYPTGGFMEGNANAGQPFNPQVGTISETSSDVLIPAFLAAYSGRNPRKQGLNPFPSLAAILPNWRVTYDGLINLGNLKKYFKSFTLNHTYNCTYTVGSYNGFLNWIGIDGSSNLGFTLDELSGQPIPSSPFNISSVVITERFAPLVGVKVTLQNDLRINVEWTDSRTLTLNSSAGQIVEANQRGITVGAGYKIPNLLSVLKIKGGSTTVSSDLDLQADFKYAETQALIRRIEANYTQATSGTRNISANFTAKYALSRRIQLGMFFEHQVNTPLVSNSAFPTSNTAYGITCNLSLAR